MFSALILAAALSPAPLTLQQAIDTALAANTQARLAQVSVDAARARVSQARAAFMPGLAAQYAYQYQDNVSKLVTPFGTLPFAPNTTNVPLAVLQYNVYDGGASTARFGQAEAGLAAAESSARGARNAVIMQTSKAYFDLLGAERGADVAQRAVTLSEEHLRLARERFGAGVIPKAELLAAQTERAQREMEAIAARNAVSIAQGALDAQMNVPLDRSYVLTEPLDVHATMPALGELVQQALTARPEVRAANDAIRAARIAVEAARASGRPRVDLTMSEGNAQPVLMTGYHAQFTLGLRAVWSLFDGGFTAASATLAQTAVSQASLQLEGLRSDVELQVRDAYANYGSALAQVDAADRLVALANENQRLAELRYRNGVGTAIELRDAELRDVQALQSQLRARIALRESLVALRYAAGLM